MRTRYDADTDTLLIEVLNHPSVESDEPVDGVLLDLDANGHVTDITIEHVSRIVELSKVEGLPSQLDKLRGKSAQMRRSTGEG